MDKVYRSSMGFSWKLELFYTNLAFMAISDYKSDVLKM